MKKFLIGILVIILCLIGAGGIVLWQAPSLIEQVLLPKEQKDLNSYYGVSDKQVAIISEGSLKDEKGLLIDNQVYLPYEFVKLNLDSRFYWDGSSNTFIFTDAVKINQNSIQQKDKFYQKDGQLYLSLDFIKSYMEIESEIFKNPNRIYLNKVEKNRTYVKTKSKINTRTVASLKGLKISGLKKGEEVEVISRPNDVWSFVRTKDGHIGYVLNLMLKESTTNTKKTKSTYKEAEYTNISLGEKVCLGWQQVSVASANNKMESLLKDTKGLNVISPTWFAIKSDDGNYTSFASADYVKKAHKMGLQVWALVDDFDKNMSIYNVLSNTKVRLNLARNLVRDVKKVGADGINVDFEYVSSEAGWHYLEFLRELSALCRKEKLILSVDNTNPTYIREQYHMSEQGSIVDYVIIMAYDEHWQGSEAGSVASLSYVSDGITNALDMVPPEKLINGIPFYTRVWKEVPEQYATDSKDIREDGNSEYERYQLTSSAYSMDAVSELINKYKAEPSWDETLGQYYVEIPLKEGKYRIWMEDARSLEQKLKLVQDNNLAGIACWKLGLESNDVWPVIAKYNQK